MNRENTVSMNLSAPNLMNVCIDEAKHEELCGRMYHYYGKEPVQFSGILELLKRMEDLFDGIAFPQASTRSRSFTKKEEKAPYNVQLPERLTDERQLIGQRGKLATLLVRVGYRQNSTWQGEALWLERNEKKQFRNELEFLALLKLASQKCEDYVTNGEK